MGEQNVPPAAIKPDRRTDRREMTSVTAGNSTPATAAVTALVTDLARRLASEGLPEHAADLRSTHPTAPDAPAAPSAALPALRHLPKALRIARTDDATGLAQALTSARWTQTNTYVRNPPNERFLRGYAHCTLLGPATALPVAIDPAGLVTLGVLLLGPHLHYPPHWHPADEVYLPLTTARWSTDQSPYKAREPGTILHHTPTQSHAIHTDAVPLLALYLWRGDLHTPARLINPPH
ncbi:dimethylsulfonioproprionate lyase family protein [Amycolatopsis carbonis]|uniref:Dimethylsulfonioproprionate lyase family protein n=1 Tax=Amycolatopsis carbonis TaxID=715471 RepID=A0A9Y2MSH9_9PSEU|nr:dimethylsulfonioproprionate lyase family protein [Amycolatopsis sp. 2-15]WIX76646.1 dimethylsulfonioproprionate lyase family protein [Amycolatopsis sp. 2-15]